MLGHEVVQKTESWKKAYQSRKDYCTWDRRPFFKIAAKYLPRDKKSIIVDIGSGEGGFVNYLDLNNKYKNLYLLDGNSATIEKIKNTFANTLFYKAPQKLPFDDLAVSYIHCSHLIEHLNNHELYQFLKEIDRVLAKDGIFIISSPMLWRHFYSDLSHIKPYNPEVLMHYLCSESKNRTAEVISDKYSVLELAYRYWALEFDEGWGSDKYLIDFIIQIFKKFFSKLGMKRYTKNGYTIVLKKG